MRLASMVNCEPPTRSESTATVFSADIVRQREPIVGLQLQVHVARVAGE